MTVLQLQLNLWQQLAEAQQSPHTVDWQQLCLAFDQAMDNTSAKLKLAMAADAIVEMADVFVARADEFFNHWRRVPEDGPVLDEDLFAEFVRQSFHLDLDGLVGVPELYVRSASEKSHEDADSGSPPDVRIRSSRAPYLLTTHAKLPKLRIEKRR
jgi:hypothetical protein